MIQNQQLKSKIPICRDFFLERQEEICFITFKQFIMIYQKTELRSLFEYASYLVGESPTITVQFDFRFPASLPELLDPQLTMVKLYDANDILLERINNGSVDIPQTSMEVNYEGVNEYNLLFQTNFRIVGDIKDREKLEEILKKCKTVYTIGGGAQGKSVYTLFDNVYISEDKTELYLFKQINLKKLS